MFLVEKRFWGELDSRLEFSADRHDSIFVVSVGGPDRHFVGFLTNLDASSADLKEIKDNSNSISSYILTGIIECFPDQAKKSLQPNSIQILSALFLVLSKPSDLRNLRMTYSSQQPATAFSVLNIFPHWLDSLFKKHVIASCWQFWGKLKILLTSLLFDHLWLDDHCQPGYDYRSPRNLQQCWMKWQDGDCPSIGCPFHFWRTKVTS